MILQLETMGYRNKRPHHHLSKREISFEFRKLISYAIKSISNQVLDHDSLRKISCQMVNYTNNTIKLQNCEKFSEVAERIYRWQ